MPFPRRRATGKRRLRSGKGFEDQPEGSFEGGLADVGAGAGETAFGDDGAAGSRDGEEDEADGFIGRSAARAGDAADGDGVVGAGGGARAFGHGADGFGADGASGGEEIGWDAEQADFEVVGIGDETAEVPGGAAGEGGQGGADEAARAGFGGGEGFIPPQQGGGDGFVEGFHGEDYTADGEGGKVRTRHFTGNVAKLRAR